MGLARVGVEIESNQINRQSLHVRVRLRFDPYNLLKQGILLPPGVECLIKQ